MRIGLPEKKRCLWEIISAAVRPDFSGDAWPGHMRRKKAGRARSNDREPDEKPDMAFDLCACDSGLFGYDGEGISGSY